MEDVTKEEQSVFDKMLTEELKKYEPFKREPNPEQPISVLIWACSTRNHIAKLSKDLSSTKTKLENAVLADDVLHEVEELNDRIEETGKECINILGQITNIELKTKLLAESK